MESTGEIRHAYLLTMVIGHTVFQAFGHSHDEPVATGPFRGRDDITPQIWPIVNDSVAFPRPIGLGDEGVDAFATRLKVSS